MRAIPSKAIAKFLTALLTSIVILAGAYWGYKHYKHITIESDIVKEAANILSTVFKKSIQIQSVTEISESGRRNRVLRLMIKDPQRHIPVSIILKQAVMQSGNVDRKALLKNFARDWAGLQFVNTLNTRELIAPRFYGGNKEHCFILLEDLGEPHLSLVDTLSAIGKDQEATSSLQRFMVCLGQLHGYSYRHTGKYLNMLHDINPAVETAKSKIPEQLNQLKTILNNYQIDWTLELEETINSVLDSIEMSGPFTTFIHGDICPDNTFYDPKKKTLLLIDFEAGKVRSALLDATYLRMSMPTCWCAKALPNEPIESLELVYRQQLMEKIPAAKNDAIYYSEYVNACAFWMLQSLRLVKIVEKKDDDWGCSSVRSRILSRLQAFVVIAKQYNKLPKLIALAEQMIQKLSTKWPDTKALPLFPAYNDRKK